MSVSLRRRLITARWPGVDEMLVKYWPNWIRIHHADLNGNRWTMTKSDVKLIDGGIQGVNLQKRFQRPWMPTSDIYFKSASMTSWRASRCEAVRGICVGPRHRVGKSE